MQFLSATIEYTLSDMYSSTTIWFSHLSYTWFTIWDLDIEAQPDLRPDKTNPELNWTELKNFLFVVSLYM